MKLKVFAVCILSASIIVTSTASDPESETPTLDRLKQQHNIENPERNFRDLESLKLGQPGLQETDRRTEEQLNRFFELGLQDGEQMDFSFYHQNLNRESLQNNAASWAFQSSSTVGMPALNQDGSFKLEYSAQGTLSYQRGDNGEYGFVETEGGPRRTSGLQHEDLFSQEINNPDHGRFDSIKDSYGNEEALFSHGSQNLNQLRNNQHLTSDAVAYRTLLDSQERALETQINENFLEGTREFLDDFQRDPSDFFSACRIAQTTTRVGADGQLSREYTCEDVDRNNYDFCEIRRSVELEDIGYYNYIVCSGPGLGQPYWVEGEPARMCSGLSNPETPLGTMTLLSIIENRVEAGIWEALGQQGGLLGSFAYLEKQEKESLQYKVSDYPKGCYSKVGGELPKGSDNNDSGLKCPNSHYWQQGTFACNGSLISEKDSENGRYRQCLYRDSFNQFCPVYEMTIEAPEQQSSGFSIFSATAQQSSSCSYEGYQIIEEGSRNWPQSILDGLGPLFPGDTGNVTWRVNLEGYACEPFDGKEICMTPYGEDGEICKSWYGWFGRHDEDLSSLPPEHPARNDSCAAYRNNPNCERIESTCVEGMRDGDVCRIANVRYECAVDVGGSREIITETNQCEAMIPCAGGECDNTQNEINQDFNAAALQASVLHELNNDNSCIEGDNTDGCEIFTGTYSQCSKGTGVVSAVKLAGPDCCDDPTAVGIQEYILAARMVSQFEVVQNTTTWATQPIRGGYNKIKQTGSTAWDKVSSSFTSAGESAAGNAAGAVAGEGASEGIFASGMAAVSEATRRWMANNLPQGVAHSIFATATTEEGVTTIVGDPPQWSEGMQQFGNFAQGLMTAYSYYTMAKLAMDLMFQCDAEESEAAGSIAQLQCVYLGEGSCKLNMLVGCARREYEYCCFNSLLARIVMEQAVEQLDRPLTQGDQGSCRGLTLDELAQLDWDLIDLESEWLPLMYESGLIFENTTEDMLTGDGRMINQGAREVVSERTKNRFRDITDQDRRDLDTELRTTLDCSQYPRPPVCNYQ